jgi:hypothetical protein
MPWETGAQKQTEEKVNGLAFVSGVYRQGGSGAFLHHSAPAIGGINLSFMRETLRIERA